MSSAVSGCSAAISHYIHVVNEAILKKYGYFYFQTEKKADGFSYSWQPKYLDTLESIYERFPYQFVGSKGAPGTGMAKYNASAKVYVKTPTIKSLDRSTVYVTPSDTHWSKIAHAPLRFNDLNTIIYATPLTDKDKDRIARAKNPKLVLNQIYAEDPTKHEGTMRYDFHYPTYCTPLFTAQDARGVTSSNISMPEFLNKLVAKVCKVYDKQPPVVGWTTGFNLARYVLEDDEYAAFVALCKSVDVKDVLMQMCLSAAMYPFRAYEDTAYILTLSRIVGTNAIPAAEQARWGDVVDLYSKIMESGVPRGKFTGQAVLKFDDLPLAKTILAECLSVDDMRLMLAERAPSERILYVLLSHYAEANPLVKLTRSRFAGSSLTAIQLAGTAANYFWGYANEFFVTLYKHKDEVATTTQYNPFDMYMELPESVRLDEFNKIMDIVVPETSRETVLAINTLWPESRNPGIEEEEADMNNVFF